MPSFEEQLVAWAQSRRRVLGRLVAITGSVEGWLRAEAALEAFDGGFGTIRRVEAERNRWDLLLHRANNRTTAVEFKLIYNNKNWVSQCNGVWDDLLPPAGSKKAAIEADRLALVTIVRGEYKHKNPHQRRADREVGWRDALDSYLLQTNTAHRNRIEVLWSGNPIAVTGRRLLERPQVPHSMQFLVLGPTEAEIKRSR